MYTIPDEYRLELHHVRPRFKNDVENVLFYIAFHYIRNNNYRRNINKTVFSRKYIFNVVASSQISQCFT